MEDCPLAKENIPELPESNVDTKQERTESTSSEAEKRPAAAEPVAVPKGVQGPKKIDVLLKATGDAPIIRQKKWAVESYQKISYVISFLRKYLNMDSSESLFIYVNQAFAPSPDQLIKNLYECFGTDGKLVLHYCKSQAWG